MRNHPKLRWFPYGGGIILLVLGLLVLFWPGMITNLFPAIIGTLMIFLGAQSLASVLFLKDKLREPGLKLVSGFVQIIVGVVFLAKRDISLAFMAILFGMYALVSSGIALSDAVQQYKTDFRACVAGVVESLFGFVMGALILFAPFSGHSVWSKFLGIFFLLAAAHSFFWARKITSRAPRGQEEEGPGENKE